MAGGIADHLHVPVLWVRVAFVLLAPDGRRRGPGLRPAVDLRPAGVPGRARPATGQPGGTAAGPGIAAVGVALLIVGDRAGVRAMRWAWVLGPLGLAAIGAAFIWREADDARRARWRRTAAGIVGPSRARGGG